MKKILLVTQGFPLGNSERGFLETEYEILQQQAEVYILAVTELENTFPNDRVVTFQTYRPSFFEMISQLFRKEVLADIVDAKRACNCYQYLMRIRRIMSQSANAVHIERIMESIIQEKGIEIVYTYWCLYPTVAAIRLKDKYNIKVVTRFHGYDLYQFREKYGWQPLKKYISAGAEKLAFICDTAMKYYNNEYGDYTKKSIISFLGTKAYPQTVKKHTDVLKVVSCSNVIPLKRVEMIANSIQLASRYIKLEWHHIGGPKKTFDFLKNENVSYIAHGVLPHDEVINAFHEICPDVFITLSSSEGLPVAVQESLAMGIPVIATDVGGTAEIVKNDYNGYLLPPNVSEQTVANILIAFSSLPESERQRYSGNALAMWEKKCNAVVNAQGFVEQLITL